MDELIKRRDIGTGSIGTVTLYDNINSKERVVLKIIDKSSVSFEIQNYLDNELNIFEELSRYKNPNILNLKSYKITIKEYLIRMEYCSGGSISKCLEKYIKKYGKPFPEKTVQHLMKQIVNGLKFIHEKDIIHRDLQNKNIYVKFYDDEKYNELNMNETHVKIGDFGFSIRKRDVNKKLPVYKDPILINKYNQRIILKEIDYLDKSTDIWSLGALCYQMLTGKKIFRFKNISELFQNTSDNSFPISFSKEVISFLSGMLEYDYRKRLTIDQLSNHDFLTKDINDFEIIKLDKDRRERMNPNENSRFSRDMHSSVMNSSFMFSQFLNTSENSGSKSFEVSQAYNKSIQIPNFNYPQNRNINNIIQNNPIQNNNINYNYQNIPNNLNLVNNNSVKKNQIYQKVCFNFLLKLH